MSWTVHLEGGPKKVNHAAASVGELVYSFGGYCSTEDFVNIKLPIPVYILNTETLRWSLIKHGDKECPNQRYGHTVVPYHEKVTNLFYFNSILFFRIMWLNTNTLPFYNKILHSLIFQLFWHSPFTGVLGHHFKYGEKMKK